MTTTTTVPARSLGALSTSDLLAQYELSISSFAGRFSNTSPRQKRIDKIVAILLDRAEHGDAIADRWLTEA